MGVNSRGQAAGPDSQTNLGDKGSEGPVSAQEDGGDSCSHSPRARDT